MSGLGADEIFGGYSRYRVAFLRSGYKELHNEMNFGKLKKIFKLKFSLTFLNSSIIPNIIPIPLY